MLLKEIIILTVIAAVIQTSVGNFYQGPCPKPEPSQNFSCMNPRKRYLVLATLSTSKHTVNFFYNTFEKPDCAFYAIRCGSYKLYAMDFWLSCRNENSNFKYCYPIIVAGQEFPVSLSVKFDFVPGVECNKRKIWNKFYLLYYIEDKLSVFWACRPIDKDSNEQGLLILLEESENTADKKASYMKLVQEKVDPKFIHKSDLIYNSNNLSDCACNNCDYFMKCQVDDGFDMIDEDRGLISTDQTSLAITTKILLILVGVFTPVIIMLNIVKVFKIRKNKVVPFNPERRRY
jgi:hypothetical protein